jgi:trehalose 2-sulfotransferase
MSWFAPHDLADLGTAAPELDGPGRTAITRVLVVASSPRTGSNLLCDALRATGQAGMPFEYLNGHGGFMAWRARGNLPSPTLRGRAGMLKRRAFGDPGWLMCYRWNQRSIERYLDWIAELRTTPNGVFAIKVHGRQFDEWTARYQFDVLRWGAPVSWVHLQREDRLAQAVSHSIAVQTGQWSSTGQAVASPVYDAAMIAAALQTMQGHEDCWSRFFAERGIQPFELTYERLVGDFEHSVRAVLALLDVEVESVPPQRLRRQSGQVNEEWIERFTLDRPHLALGARGAGPGPG